MDSEMCKFARVARNRYQIKKSYAYPIFPAFHPKLIFPFRVLKIRKVFAKLQIPNVFSSMLFGTSFWQ